MPKVHLSAPEQRLQHCCGVGEIGGWTFKEKSDWGPIPTLDNMRPSDTGLFVCTFTKSDACQAALAELLEKHTVLFNTDYVPTTSPYATPIGQKHGIALYVFNYGKEVTK